MKYVTEQIAHIPTPLAAFHIEGKGYTMQGISKVKPPNFTWGGGKGRLEIE
jgi:hypothetical protein